MLLRLAAELAAIGVAAAWYLWVVVASWPFGLFYWPLWLLALACYLAWRNHRRSNF